MQKHAKRYVLLGMFAAAVVAAILLFVGIVVGRSNPLESKHTIYVEFDDLKGIRAGTPVSIQGHVVGAVSRIAPDPQNAGPPLLVAELRLSADERFTDWIREDSKFIIVNQNLFGDKRIDITFGSPERPKLPDGARVRATPTASVQDVLDKITDTAVTLTGAIRGVTEGQDLPDVDLGQIFQNIEETTRNVAELSRTVNLALGGDDPAHRDELARNVRKAVEALGSMGDTLREAAEKLDPATWDKLQIFVLVQNLNDLLYRLRTVLDPARGAAPPEQTYDDFAAAMKNLREVTADLKEVLAQMKKAPAPEE